MKIRSFRIERKLHDEKRSIVRNHLNLRSVIHHKSSRPPSRGCFLFPGWADLSSTGGNELRLPVPVGAGTVPYSGRVTHVVEVCGCTWKAEAGEEHAIFSPPDFRPGSCRLLVASMCTA